LNAIDGTLQRQPSPEPTREIILQQSSVGFDLSLYQIFLSLVGGGMLIIAPPTIRGDAVLYLQQCSSWKLANSAGENIPSCLKEQLLRLNLPDLTLANWFGPTEVDVFVTDVPYTNRPSRVVDEYPLLNIH